MGFNLNCLCTFTSKEMIIPSRMMFYLVTIILAIFVIQFCSVDILNTSSVFALTNNSYPNNNDGNQNGTITSGIRVDSYPVGIAVNPNYWQDICSK